MCVKSDAKLRNFCHTAPLPMRKELTIFAFSKPNKINQYDDTNQKKRH